MEHSLEVCLGSYFSGAEIIDTILNLDEDFGYPWLELDGKESRIVFRVGLDNSLHPHRSVKVETEDGGFYEEKSYDRVLVRPAGRFLGRREYDLERGKRGTQEFACELKKRLVD